jgi:hypothetical protein
MQLLLRLTVLAFLSLFAFGCSPGYKIVRQAEPNPFLGVRNFVVLPVEFGDVRVGRKQEADYLAGKEDHQVDSFEADKEALAQLYLQALADGAADEGVRVDPATGEVATFIVRAVVRAIEPGWYAGVMASPSLVQMTVTISDKNGAELDEIFVEHQTQGSIMNAASGQRLRSDGEAMGGITADYILTRVLGEN